MSSIRRTGRRYLRGAVETSHDFQEFLNENPAVASGLASVGSLLMNAMMQSKYGPALQELLNPGANKTAAPPAAGATAQAAPKAAPAKPAAEPAAKPTGKEPRGSRRAAKKTAKKAAKKK